MKIRDMKRIAVENGFEEFKQIWEGATEKTAVKAAVVGAGPAGLSAAYFLARAGFDTAVFEREESAEELSDVIPGFGFLSSYWSDVGVHQGPWSRVNFVLTPRQ